MGLTNGGGEVVGVGWREGSGRVGRVPGADNGEGRGK